MPMVHFDQKDFEVSITNIVSNIYRNINKFLPNIIIYFTRQNLQNYLLPIITRKDRSSLFYLHYGSICQKLH